MRRRSKKSIAQGLAREVAVGLFALSLLGLLWLADRSGLILYFTSALMGILTT
jgi:hypothetical protein